MTEVIARLIIAIVAEFDAEAMEGTVVEAAEKTFHDVTGFEVETFERGKQFGIEALGEGLGGGRHG